MIIVSIFGGIGNQMFQYAFGKSLAKTLNVDFKYNYSYNLVRTDFNPKDIQSIFDLFNLEGQQASISEIRKFGILKNEKNVYKFLSVFTRVLGFNRNYYHIIEKNKNFDESIFAKYSGNLYLSGHWQSEKYFISISESLKEDFQFKIDLGQKNTKFFKLISQSNSVSVHLRGRDYISNIKTKKQHFTCDINYYQRAFSFIKSSFKNLHFFIFSDDPIWAKDFLKDFADNNFTFITENEWNTSPINDMYLMSLCQINIIANSSFSWWAAWLNKNPNKVIICPKKWHNDNQHNIEDLIPSSWVII